MNTKLIKKNSNNATWNDIKNFIVNSNIQNELEVIIGNFKIAFGIEPDPVEPMPYAIISYFDENHSFYNPYRYLCSIDFICDQVVVDMTIIYSDGVNTHYYDLDQNIFDNNWSIARNQYMFGTNHNYSEIKTKEFDSFMHSVINDVIFKNS